MEMRLEQLYGELKAYIFIYTESIGNELEIEDMLEI